ncbi:SOS response-associated peptidase [Deinococcus yavapaiensis]|uniref:Abasic site processing protein n=1 Tax=Deinococcus yavapaiensis KR-236 TaxID=694435 RepID=A0A318SBQ8_9DEIO|nr:SOS response-associated peptidase [Deinococcus yavapaiensis]PYE48342.1 putative SOS response-associated peptidase YedK [Deinococcus yavapaiensis KR-236]
MCGRLTESITRADFMRFFGMEKPGDLPPRFNVAPTQHVVIITHHPHGRAATLARWGLIPPDLTPDDAKRLSLFNARRETLLTKRPFSRPFRRRRCLVPVSGLYEWHDGQPFHVRRKDGKPLVLAGLWESAFGDEGELLSCTVITTTPNADLTALHDRMPVMLLSKDWDAWLDPATPLSDAERLLEPFAAGVLDVYAVSKDVGNVRNEGAHLVERLPGNAATPS